MTNNRLLPRPLRVLGVALGVLLLAAFAFRRLPATYFATSGASPAASSDTLGLLPVDEWLNTTIPLSGQDLRGQVVLVEYWTYLCYNCRNVQPWMLATQAKYAPRGLQVVGIHTPEFNEERQVGNVRAYAMRNGITWPIGIDNDYRVWRLYNTTNAWPAFFVYDRRGRLRYHAAGENAVDGAEEAIRRALADTAGSRTAPTGVRIGVHRSGAALQVTLVPAPGYKLVRSPANEIWFADDTIAPAGMVGEPFPATGHEVKYFTGGASATVPLPAGVRGPVRGHILYRYCSEVEKVCLQRSEEFEG